MTSDRSKPTQKVLAQSRFSREELIERAESAISEMQGEFATWIVDEINDLTAAQEKWLKAPGDTETVGELFRRAHDLKGQAPTLGYPIVGRIAASLCDLLSCSQIDSNELKRLTLGHVDAVKAAVRDEIKDESEPVAQALAVELENAVQRIAADDR